MLVGSFMFERIFSAVPREIENLNPALSSTLFESEIILIFGRVSVIVASSLILRH